MLHTTSHSRLGEELHDSQWVVDLVWPLTATRRLLQGQIEMTVVRRVHFAA